MQVHHHPQNWNDPDTFDPVRPLANALRYASLHVPLSPLLVNNVLSSVHGGYELCL